MNYSLPWCPMVSSIRRRAHSGRSTSIEHNGYNGYETVRTRTQQEEYRHACAMDRWVRKGGGGDHDHSMDY